IGAGGPADAVIDRVDAEQGVLTAEGVVQPEVSKILSHRLHGIGIAERSAPAEFGAVWRGPQIEEGRDARREPDKVSRSIGDWQISEPRVVIRHDRNTAQREPLTKPLIASKDKSLVLLDRPSGRASKLVALKRRG